MCENKDVEINNLENCIVAKDRRIKNLEEIIHGLCKINWKSDYESFKQAAYISELETKVELLEHELEQIMGD